MPDSERRGIRKVQTLEEVAEIRERGIEVVEGSPEFYVLQVLVEKVDLVSIQKGDRLVIGPTSKDDQEFVERVWHGVREISQFVQLSDAFRGSLTINKSLEETLPPGDLGSSILASLIEYASRSNDLGILDRIVADRWTDEDVEGMVRRCVNQVIADEGLQVPGSS